MHASLGRSRPAIGTKWHSTAYRCTAPHAVRLERAYRPHGTRTELIPRRSRLGFALYWCNMTRTLVRVRTENRCTSGPLTSPLHDRAPLRPARDRAQVAGDLGAREDVAGLERGGRGRAEVVRARDAPVPLGRAPHGPPEELLGRRRGRPLPPPHGPPRAPPDGLRRVRPPGREPRDQDRRAPARLDRRVDRRSSSASSASGASRSTGRASSPPPSRATTAGPSGSSCASSSAASPTARRPRSTGARRTRPCWPTSR